MTALTIIQDACSVLGLDVPTGVFSSTDSQVMQLRSLMNKEGKELAKGASTDHAWRVLITEKTFSTTAAAAQTGAVPTNFGWFLNGTMWNRSLTVRYEGPVSPQEWQQYQSISLVALPNGVFRFRGSDLLIFPTPTASQTVAYEYVSKNWALSAASVALSAMTADTDTSLIDETLITLGVTWRFKASKGLDYAEDFRTYQLEVTKAIGRDGGRKANFLGGRPRYPWNGNIPEANWPS